MDITKDFGERLRGKRKELELSLKQLGYLSAFSEGHLSKIERGVLFPPEETRLKLMDVLELYEITNPMFLLIDYVRIRFPTKDIHRIVRDVLRLKPYHLVYEQRGMFGYTGRYYLGDVILLTSPEEEKGILLELRGRGCRQFEGYLRAQGRTWQDFFAVCLGIDAVMKRLDLAVNDCVGILDIPELIRKSEAGECRGFFRTFQTAASGEYVSRLEQNKATMGKTLYMGSMKSDAYFCVYEKDYEEYIKKDIPLEEALIKNRFEVRLMNDRAYNAVMDLVTHDDPDDTVFSIIDYYICFTDEDAELPPNEWAINERWAWFVGDGRRPIKLTMTPKPYELERTLRWYRKQVDATSLMLETIREKGGEDFLTEIRKTTKLSSRQKKIIQQLTNDVSEFIA